MTLPKAEVDRFYNIWFALLHFTNEQRKVVPDLTGKAPQGKVDSNLAIKVRNILWKNTALLDQFIAENPAHLPPEDLESVRNWQYRRAGTFVIYKTYKKHAIFISQENKADVFAVKGLASSFEEIFGSYIPIMVEAVLLPFNDEIITDGLFQTYSVTFGPGIRANFKEAYEDAKELGAIITSLLPVNNPPSLESQVAKAELTNTKVLDAFQKFQYQAGLSPKTVERDMGIISSIAQYLLAQQPTPVSLREISDLPMSNYLEALPERDRKTGRISLRRFISFLRDTGRVNWDEAENMLDRLKG
jgi:hypothetical protein